MLAHLRRIHLRFVFVKAAEQSLDRFESKHAPFRLPGSGIEHQYIDVFRIDSAQRRIPQIACFGG